MSVYNQKAVALKYDEKGNIAPIVVASGMGYMAERIVEVATQNEVPIYEDNSLATVLSKLEVGREIPENLYGAIVDIYAYFLNFSPDGKTLVDIDEEIHENIEEEQKENE